MYIFKWFKKKMVKYGKTHVTQEVIRTHLDTPVRTNLVSAYGLTSFYKKKYDPTQRWDVKVFKEGALIVPEMFEALKKLDELVRGAGGEFYITDLFRSWQTQARARAAYEIGEKAAYVAPPGSSFHGGGRAVDVSVKELNFKDIPKEKWLEKLWDLAIPLGFRPIIKKPDLNASESWHFDYVDKDWVRAYVHLPNSEVAKCCILDIGKWNPEENIDKVNRMFCQAQLHRLGYFTIGVVDGIFGPKTNNVLEYLGLKDKHLGFIVDTLSDM